MLRACPSLLVAILMEATLAAGCLSSPAAGTSAQRDTSVDFQPCTLSLSTIALNVAAECGRLEVPEDRHQPDGRTVSLRIARVRTRAARPEPDPLFVLAGGPGQAATEAWLTLGHSLRDLDRDVVLVDQRGTGGSNPLSCPMPTGMDLADMSDDAVGAWVATCLSQLDADPAQYTTAAAIADLEAVRAALTYEHVNLYGVSYGTRVAFAYARAWPERVRTIVADGVVPTDLVVGPDFQANADRALSMLLKRCAEDDACGEAFGDLRPVWTRLVNRLERIPRQVQVAHPRTANEVEVTLDGDTLRDLVRLLLYQTETSSLLPLLIDEAARGNLAPLAALSKMLDEELDATLSNAMSFSVICSEDFPEFPESGNRLTRGYDRVCRHWPRGPVPEDFRSPLRIQSPVLLLSGENDPVTPPSYGDRMRDMLPNSRHVVMTEQGHGVVIRGCAHDFVREFIRSGSLEDLDTECSTKIRAPSFFIDFGGPAP